LQVDHAKVDKLPGIPAGGAVVAGIEAHPKKPHMYKIALRFNAWEETGSCCSDPGGEGENWNAEVDALISGAKSAKEAEETVLTVHEDTLVSGRLLKGKLLSAEEVEVLRQDELKEDAYRSALLMLERRARTKAELVQALKRKGYAEEIASACVTRLQQRRLVDDSAFARRFAEQRATGQRKGRLLIRQELLQRGVERHDVDRALNELDAGTERESALAMARKRWPSLKGNDRERKHKLIGALLRRGFPSEVVRAAVQQAAADSGRRDSDEDDDEDSFHNSYAMDD
jgi:SOS response regulatory protein OraA/RecX